MIRTLPRAISPPPGKPVPAEGAELRGLARQIAIDPAAWTPELAALVADLFDEMAPAWDAEHATGRTDFLADALAGAARCRPGSAWRSARAPVSTPRFWLRRSITSSPSIWPGRC
jgi:hypothetical protein